MIDVARALPSVDDLLGRDRMLERVAGLLGSAGRELVAAEPFYLRYKPARSALLGVALDWAGERGTQRTWASLYVGEEAEAARAKVETLRPLEPARGPAFASDRHALLLAFPNDRALRGLSAAGDARRLGNRLARTGGAISGGWRVRARRSAIELVRWKPGRRAVLRAKLALVDDASGARDQLAAWVRVTLPDALPTLLSRWRCASQLQGVATPSILDVDLERGFFVTSEVSGGPLVGHAMRGSPAWRALAVALAHLHLAQPPGSAADHCDGALLAAAEKTLGSLAEMVPSEAGAIEGLRVKLVQARAALPPAAMTCIHGDLTADQVLVHGESVILLDWDEMGVGDPHADFGSLAADLRVRRVPDAVALVAALALESLGALFDSRRFAWQRALAECRLAMRGLQRGHPSWRDEARVALAEAERAISELEPACSIGPATASSQSVLARLLDPQQRARLACCQGTGWLVAAVWPEREGVTVRLERAALPGEPARWLRLGQGIGVHDFPHDPDLPELATLLRSGRFTLAGHRLGRRATLREPTTRRFLFLRPRGKRERAYQALAEAHLHLKRAGVPHAELQQQARELSGWWMTEVEGAAVSVARTPAEVWEGLGSDLARVHAQVAPSEELLDGTTRAIASARRQLAASIRPDQAFTAWISERIDELHVSGHGTPAWIHGDLHPGQIVARAGVAVMLDWERAGVGEAEEDLGNLAAHLAWEDETLGRVVWGAVRRGYAAAGGRADPVRSATHMRVALLRVLAVHSWRDVSRARATDTVRWESFLKECGSW